MWALGIIVLIIQLFKEKSDFKKAEEKYYMEKLFRDKQ